MHGGDRLFDLRGESGAVVEPIELSTPKYCGKGVSTGRGHSSREPQRCIVEGVIGFDLAAARRNLRPTFPPR